MNKLNFSTHEEFILLAIALLQPEAYALAIKKELAQSFRIKLALATVHTILYRLDRKGYLNSKMGGQDERRGGRSKRLYSLSKSGADIILALREARESAWSRLPADKLILNKAD